jgi:hypothetical protein
MICFRFFFSGFAHVLAIYPAVQSVPILTFLMERVDGLSTGEKQALSADISKRFSALADLNVYDYDADAAALDIPKLVREIDCFSSFSSSSLFLFLLSPFYLIRRRCNMCSHSRRLLP